ncbi:MAG TPA: DUF6084 family protein [Acidothermaceae bacterium]|jgi:hypothetical protein|nr:DUF6084 family protein [Acidothermaceae bacterium]
MADLEFACTGAKPDTAAASPTILLRLHIEETTGAAVHALVLRTQIRIAPQRRRYDDAEAEGVRDLFGARSRWGDSLNPIQLAFVNNAVPGFTGSTDIDLSLPCSYDFDVAANKYLYALDAGDAPLVLLFSGTIFTAGEGTAGISVEPIPWHKETTFRMPVEVWKQTMDLHFPGAAWLRLRRETFDALHRYRINEEFMSWDDAIERLLKEAQR